jgi:hypothetical protein
VACLDVLSDSKNSIVAAGLAPLGKSHLLNGEIISGAHAILTAIVAAGLRDADAGPKS